MVILTKALVGRNKDDFAKEVRLKLLIKKMTYAELGSRIGFAEKTISNNLTGKTISKFVASAIAEELDIDISKYEKE